MAVHGFLDGSHGLLAEQVTDRFEQLRLVTEMVIHGAPGDAGAGQDGLGAGVGIALFGKQVAGGIDQAAAGLGAALCIGGHGFPLLVDKQTSSLFLFSQSRLPVCF